MQAPSLPHANEISPERREELIEYMARRVTRMGLGSAAMFAIEMNRPLAFVYSSFVHLASPVASVVFNPRMLSEIALLLEDRSNFDRLIRRIEELEEEEQKRRAFQRKRARSRPLLSRLAFWRGPQGSDPEGPSAGTSAGPPAP